ncbi:YraN family protein [Candidatus Bealeia paramacronuclearis]|uniref:YraN family protein n=1 Tax=Candidatus Bealeia paramacronuclearis TaxID=1921001 RepID=UPI002F266F22
MPLKMKPGKAKKNSTPWLSISKTSFKKRLRAWRWGQFAEKLAAYYLRLKGYHILHHRFASPVGEIDLIAKRNDSLVFVEVKARKTKAIAAESISPHQKRRIERAGEYFLQNWKGPSPQTIRFDVVLIAPWRWPEHIRSAWMTS